MNLVVVIVFCFNLLCTARGGTINHDQVEPFPQPDPVTISEKAAIKFKPQLFIGSGCVSFPAVNAAGEITGGLKGSKNTEGCDNAPLGSQVYGRSAWYQDKWAILYAWYFPKNFGAGEPKKRHDWASVVLWIDNPAVENPKIFGASLSQQTLEPATIMFMSVTDRNKEPYKKMIELPAMAFVGTELIRHNRLGRRIWNYTYEGGSNTSTRVTHSHPDKFNWIALAFSYFDGTYQDLIMWEQLTDEAREALNSADFGEAKVPFNENNFDATLGLAWPF